VFPRTWTVGVVAALALVISASAGPLGWAYSIVYVAALAPGWPIGWALADRRHPGAATTSRGETTPHLPEVARRTLTIRALIARKSIAQR
jgi:hypothetical protein